MRDFGLSRGLTLKTIIDKLTGHAPQPTKAKTRSCENPVPQLRHRFFWRGGGRAHRLRYPFHKHDGGTRRSNLASKSAPHCHPETHQPANPTDGRWYDNQTKPSRGSVPAAKIAPSLQNAGAHHGGGAVEIASDRNQSFGDWLTGPPFGGSIQAYSVRVIIGVARNYQQPENDLARKRLAL